MTGENTDCKSAKFGNNLCKNKIFAINPSGANMAKFNKSTSEPANVIGKDKINASRMAMTCRCELSLEAMALKLFPPPFQT